MDDDTKLELAWQEHEEYTYHVGWPDEWRTCDNCKNLKYCQPIKNYADDCNEYKSEEQS